MKKFSILLFVTIFFVTLNSIAQNPTIKLVGKTATGQLSDETTLIFNPIATTGFDGDLDAVKKEPTPPSTEYPLIYTITEGVNYAINNIPSLGAADLVVPLGFKPYATENYTIKRIALDGFAANVNIFLIDGKTGTKTNIRLVDEYTFQMDANAGESADRFTLVFTTLTDLSYWITANTGVAATFNYAAIPGAVKYVVEYQALAPAADLAIHWKNGTSLSLTANWLITPNTKYQWRVRAKDASGKPIPTVFDPIDGWSPYQYFTSGSVVPANVVVSNETPYSVTLTWVPIANATKYTIKFAVKGTTAYRYKSTTAITRTIGWLEPGTTYTGQIRTDYIVGGITKKGTYGGTFDFTTATAKKLISSDNSENNSTPFTVSPNPANGFTTIAYNSAVNSSVNVNITDISGRIVYSENMQAVEGANNFKFDLTGFSKGLYIVSFIQNDTTNKIKLIVE